MLLGQSVDLDTEPLGQILGQTLVLAQDPSYSQPPPGHSAPPPRQNRIFFIQHKEGFSVCCVQSNADQRRVTPVWNTCRCMHRKPPQACQPPHLNISISTSLCSV